MFRRLFRPLRRWLLKWEIGGLEARIFEDQRAVDIWPVQTLPAYRRELARLQGELDRLNGRPPRDLVKWTWGRS